LSVCGSLPGSQGIEAEDLDAVSLTSILDQGQFSSFMDHSDSDETITTTTV